MLDRVRASTRFRLRRFAKRTVLRDGTLETMWVRQVMNRSVGQRLADLEPAASSAVEISGSFWRREAWCSYTTLDYPAFDLCSPSEESPHWRTYDVVIAEQVLEHVEDPMLALGTLRKLGRPGGTVIVSTPFLIRVHPQPGDYWRFTPQGLRTILRQAGFEDIVVDSWGNRRCLRANLRRWAPYRPWHSLRNEVNYPLVVWGSAVCPASSD